MSRIAESLTPHRECEHQFEVIASLHRSEAAITFIAIIVMSTTVMLVTAVAREVFT
jgi:hypothetical protein